MPLSDAVQISSPITKYVKDMGTSGFQRLEESVMMVSEQVSAMIQERIPIKHTDPGSFVLDFDYHNERFQRSLSDLGSSVNLIPYSVAVPLGVTQFKPTNITLVLAD